MAGTTQYPHLEPDGRGEVFISGTRYKARMLAAEHFQYGWTAEELLRQHPDLKPEQVYSVLTWFYDNHATIVAGLTASLERTNAQRRSVCLSRAELVARLSPDTDHS